MGICELNMTYILSEPFVYFVLVQEFCYIYMSAQNEAAIVYL